MARQRIPRFEPPPPALSALSNMGDYNPASFASIRSIISASVASVASEASASSLSEQQAQSTAASDSDGESYTSSSASSTRETLGVIVPASTASNSAATQTDNYGSTITSPAPTAQSTNSTDSSTKSNAAAASDHAYNGPDSSLQTADRGYHTGPSSGQIAAAVVIPLVVLLALGFGLFYLRRRRRRRSAALASQYLDHHHMTDRSAFSKEAAALPEPSQPRTPRPNATAPVLTGTINNAYYTGLSTPTTPSRASTQTRGHGSADTDRRALSPYEIPPPAYAKHAPPGSTPTLPHLSFAADPFMDPISPVPSEDQSRPSSSPTAAALAALSGRDTNLTATSLSPVSNFSRPHGGVSRTGTMRSLGAASVTSDMYSDTASVHSARPARMSGGAAATHVTSSGNRLSAGEGTFAPGLVVGGGRAGDPFGDPR